MATINGTNNGEPLYGTSAADLIKGLGGDDTIDGGAGNDYLVGGLGADIMRGGTGNDTIKSWRGEGPDWIDGGSDIDTALINRGLDDAHIYLIDISTAEMRALEQDIGDNTVLVNIEILSFTGGAYGDFVSGGDFADTINGWSGDDIIYGNGGNDLLEGGGGADYLNGGLGQNRLLGGKGNDILLSAAGSTADFIDGGTGVELAGQLEADILRVDRTGTSIGLSIDMSGATNVLRTLADGTQFINIERLEFWGGSGKDVIRGGAVGGIYYGGEGDDTLVGGTGQTDYLDGGAGNDTLTAGAAGQSLYGDTGNDLITGSAGRDFIDAGIGDDRVMVTKATSGTDQVNGYLGNDTLDFSLLGNGITFTLSALGGTTPLDYDFATFVDAANQVDMRYSAFENVVGTAANDWIKGNAKSNVIDGGAGDDTIVVTQSGSLSDTLIGGAGADTLDFSDAPAQVRLTLGADGSGSFSEPGMGYRFDYSGFENVTGGAFADRINGNDLANVLIGNGGNDSLNGNGGNDILYGNDHIDYLDGGAGVDQLFGGNGNDILKSWTGSGPDLLDGGAGNDMAWISRQTSTVNFIVDISAPLNGFTQDIGDGTRLTGIEGLRLFTGSGNDWIITGNMDNEVVTGSGDDVLIGGSGNDRFNGGEGSDLLWGNGGNDVLQGAWGDDTINVLKTASHADGGIMGYDTLALHLTESEYDSQLMGEIDAYRAFASDPVLREQGFTFSFGLSVISFEQLDIYVHGVGVASYVLV